MNRIEQNKNARGNLPMDVYVFLTCFPAGTPEYSLLSSVDCESKLDFKIAYSGVYLMPRIMQDINDRLLNSEGGYFVLVSDGLISPSEKRMDVFHALKTLYSHSNILSLAVGFRTKTSDKGLPFALPHHLMDYYSGKQLVSISPDDYVGSFESIADVIMNDDFELRKTYSGYRY